MAERSRFFSSLQDKALLFRVSAHLLIGVIILVVPAVGPNRFWLAFLLLGVGTPTAIVVHRCVGDLARNWAEALVDLVMIVTLIHLVPHLWMELMALGLMIALAPSISLHPSSHWIYMSYGFILVVGMTAAALIHQVDNWALVIVAVSVTYPALLFYTYSQMRAANQLRNRAEMVQGMTQLAGSVAHDFNNMLVSITGYTELAIMNLDDKHESKAELEKVLEGTRRAKLLSSQLLSFSGRDIGRVGKINVVSEFKLTADLLRPVLPTGTTIQLTSSESALFVKAKISDLQQVWMNILINAGEAMHLKDNTIDVHISREADASQNNMPRILMRISDRGSGVPASALEKIFDPFFSTKQKGHGLGLAVTKRIMQDLDGDIVISDRQGGGTEVLITCPEAQSAGPANKPESMDEKQCDPSVQSATSLVLIVDDEPDVRTVAKCMLIKLGHEVLTAANAEEALSLFNANHQDIGVVLLDLKMPGMDGWECLRELRQISSTTPVIICSGYNPSENSPDFAAHDPNLSFLAKPYRSAQLAAAIQSHSEE